MAGEARHTIRPGLWTGLALGPLAWVLAQQVSLTLVTLCVAGGPAFILATHIATLALATLGIVLCWRGWRGTGGRAECHFLGGLGALLGGIFLVAILAQGTATLFFPGCER